MSPGGRILGLARTGTRPRPAEPRTGPRRACRCLVPRHSTSSGSPTSPSGSAKLRRLRRSEIKGIVRRWHCTLAAMQRGRQGHQPDHEHPAKQRSDRPHDRRLSLGQRVSSSATTGSSTARGSCTSLRWRCPTWFACRTSTSPARRPPAATRWSRTRTSRRRYWTTSRGPCRGCNRAPARAFAVASTGAASPRFWVVAEASRTAAGCSPRSIPAACPPGARSTLSATAPTRRSAPHDSCTPSSSTGEHELYDLKRDPFERRNVANVPEYSAHAPDPGFAPRPASPVLGNRGARRP